MTTWTVRSLCLLLLALTAASSIAGQALNGYINPLWVDRRRADSRAMGAFRNDYYLSSSDTDNLSDITRSPTMLVYLDGQGRYRPVYRQDRLFRTNDQNYYRISEPQQFLPLPSYQSSRIVTSPSP